MALDAKRARRAGPALLALLLALAACGPLPRPFQPDGKAQSDPPALGESAAVLVLPLEGDAPGETGAAAGQLAEALRALGIAAETEATSGDRLLQGEAEVSADDEGHDAVAIAWQVTDPGGSVIGAFNQVSQLPAGLWGEGQPAAVGSVMARAAQQAAALLRNRRPPTAAGRTARPRLVLLPMESLPGDGAVSLAQALERELSALDYEVGDAVDGDDLLILADLTVEPDSTGTELVSFTWWVVRAEDGADLGKVEQARQLPRGALEGRWGVLAEGIAAGAAEGIIAVIQRRWRASGKASPKRHLVSRFRSSQAYPPAPRRTSESKGH